MSTLQIHRGCPQRDHTNNQTSLMNVLFVPTHFNTLNTPIPLYLSCYKLIRMAQHLRGPVKCTRYVLVCSLINSSATSKPTQYTARTILPRTKRNYAVVFVVRVRWEHVSNAVIRNALEHSMELVGWLMEFSMILILEKHSVNSTARATSAEFKVGMYVQFCSTTEYILDN